MITETAFVDCDNLPPEMASRLDQPWTFAGEVKTKQYSIRCHCERCSFYPVSFKTASERAEYLIQAVDMPGRLFVTDDMIEVVVYFGVCSKCDSVYWARSGPPFRRARAMAPARA